jgi:RNA:NAD 2'-phosphotransferase (TPT1/KptA family)
MTLKEAKNIVIRNGYKILKEAEHHTPKILYHATYRPLLDSIMKNGLGNTDQRWWEDSEPGAVYLARDPDSAYDFAETADTPPDEYINDIVVLAIDTKYLDYAELEIDPNNYVDNEEDSTLIYYGIIDPESISIFK